MSLQDLNPDVIGSAVNHLLLSTLFLAGVALLVLAFRRTRASVRYGLWLAASVKFLVPFDVLVWIGQQFSFPVPFNVVRIERTIGLSAVDRPLPFDVPAFAVPAPIPAAPAIPEWLVPAVAAVWLCGTVLVLAAWWVRWRRVGLVAAQGSALESGREVAILRRLEAQSGLRMALSLRSVETTLEPGVFGVIRPVLLWPRGISHRLTDEQVEAILAHELSHVRRRDNLWAAMQTVVQALFWFHPLVWWLGTRLVHERERACDEDVIGLGNEPHVYAESILETCRFYVEAPIACVAGVAGSNLKQRIEQIMGNPSREALGPWRKALLAAGAVGIVATPIAFGMLNAPVHAQGIGAARVEEGVRQIVFVRRSAGPVGVARLRMREAGEVAQSPITFEVASVKSNALQSGFMGGICRGTDTETGGALAAAAGLAVPPTPLGRCVIRRTTLRMLIGMAYGLSPDGAAARITGGPSWIDSEHFDVEAKAEQASATEAELLSMLQSLLADRFGLRLHREQREVAGLALLVAEGGPRLDPPSDAGPRRGIGQFRGGPMSGRNASIAELTRVLTMRLGRPVVDATNLPGVYNFTLTWTPADTEAGPFGRLNLPPEVRARLGGSGDPNGPSLETALREQLGLRLQPQRVPQDVIVIDQVDRPSPN